MKTTTTKTETITITTTTTTTETTTITTTITIHIVHERIPVNTVFHMDHALIRVRIANHSFVKRDTKRKQLLPIKWMGQLIYAREIVG